MGWHQLRVRILREQAEAAELLLLDRGAVSVTLQDAADEPVFQIERDSIPLWQSIVATGLFQDATAATNAQLAMLAELGPAGVTAADTQLETLPDTDWERAWMADFRPMKFGQRLWVCPSWTEPPDPEAVNIMLDPGLAFGSGTHPTTSMCLAWLDAQSLAGTLTDKSVMDYGCGSGILAIAAALLGAGTVIAVDNDPQAVIACKKNCAMNRISEHRLSVWLPGEHPSDPVDVLVANILSGPLQSLTPVLATLVRPGGQILLSGVLSEQTRDIINSYHTYFEMADPTYDGDWVSIEGRRLPG